LRQLVITLGKTGIEGDYKNVICRMAKNESTMRIGSLKFLIAKLGGCSDGEGTKASERAQD
jgi:hypothetical protein